MKRPGAAPAFFFEGGTEGEARGPLREIPGGRLYFATGVVYNHHRMGRKGRGPGLLPQGNDGRRKLPWQ